MRSIAGKSINSVDSGQHDGSKHRLWQICEQSRKEQKAQREGAGSKDERERSSRACLVVDCGLRQATRDGITMAEPCQKVRRANSKEFLSRVDAISMLGRERACRRHTFDVRKQQTSGSERNDALDVAQAEPGRLKR